MRICITLIALLSLSGCSVNTHAENRVTQQLRECRLLGFSAAVVTTHKYGQESRNLVYMVTCKDKMED